MPCSHYEETAGRLLFYCPSYRRRLGHSQHVLRPRSQYAWASIYFKSTQAQHSSKCFCSRSRQEILNFPMICGNVLIESMGSHCSPLLHLISTARWFSGLRETSIKTSLTCQSLQKTHGTTTFSRKKAKCLFSSCSKLADEMWLGNLRRCS